MHHHKNTGKKRATRGNEPLFNPIYVSLAEANKLEPGKASI